MSYHLLLFWNLEHGDHQGSFFLTKKTLLNNIPHQCLSFWGYGFTVPIKKAQWSVTGRPLGFFFSLGFQAKILEAFHNPPKTFS
jgi:hypothetical protein